MDDPGFSDPRMEMDVKVVVNDPPRVFLVGADKTVGISDCGRIQLDADEQVTFVTSSGKQHDFTAKAWGFYTTPSVNGRLKDQGFKTALVRNQGGRVYVMTVERERLDEFSAYITTEGMVVEEWLDER